MYNVVQQQQPLFYSVVQQPQMIPQNQAQIHGQQMQPQMIPQNQAQIHGQRMQPQMGYQVVMQPQMQSQMVPQNQPLSQVVLSNRGQLATTMPMSMPHVVLSNQVNQQTNPQMQQIIQQNQAIQQMSQVNQAHMRQMVQHNHSNQQMTAAHQSNQQQHMTNSKPQMSQSNHAQMHQVQHNQSNQQQHMTIAKPPTNHAQSLQHNTSQMDVEAIETSTSTIPKPPTNHAQSLQHNTSQMDVEAIETSTSTIPKPQMSHSDQIKANIGGNSAFKAQAQENIELKTAKKKLEDALHAERCNHQKQMRALESRIAEYESRIAEYKVAIADAAQSLEDANVEGLNDKISLLEARAQNDQDCIAEYKELCSSIRKQQTQSIKQLKAEQTQRVKQMKSEHSTTLKTVKTLRKENNRLKKQIQTLEKSTANKTKKQKKPITIKKLKTNPSSQRTTPRHNKTSYSLRNLDGKKKPDYTGTNQSSTEDSVDESEDTHEATEPCNQTYHFTHIKDIEHDEVIDLITNPVTMIRGDVRCGKSSTVITNQIVSFLQSGEKVVVQGNDKFLIMDECGTVIVNSGRITKDQITEDLIEFDNLFVSDFQNITLSTHSNTAVPAITHMTRCNAPLWPSQNCNSALISRLSKPQVDVLRSYAECVSKNERIELALSDFKAKGGNWKSWKTVRQILLQLKEKEEKDEIAKRNSAPTNTNEETEEQS
eukprot:836031_1